MAGSGDVAALSEERSPFAIEYDAQFIAGHESVALWHMERGIALAEFVEGKWLVELPDSDDTDCHGDSGTGEVLSIFTSGET